MASSSKTTSADLDLKLRVMTPSGEEFYDLRGELITIGRARDNNLVLADHRASRYHVKLETTDDGGWRVVDVGSQNGTFLNGRRVRKARVGAGDVIQVGNTKLAIEKKLAAPIDPEAVTQCDVKVLGGAGVLPGDESSLPIDILLRLQAIARAMNSELRLERLLALIIDHAVELTRAERGFLILVGKDDMEFRVARNFERQDIGTPEFAVSWSIATQVSSSGQAVLCVNAAEDERFATNESVLSLGLRSVMCVPFRVRNRILGVVYVDNRLHKGAFTATDFRILETLADHAATALENARLYNEVLDQKSTLERLNRDLHQQVEERDSRLRAAWHGANDARAAAANPFGRPGERGALVGEAPRMRDMFALIRKVAASDLPVLITGESGSGKELVAQAIHRLSARSNGPLISENCCAIPENLLESELFGYERGAFTGAREDREGLFVAASGGTLFLDEIGDMGPALQSKLLRVLQEGEVRPLGSKEPRPIDVRVITATNRDLESMIEEGTFREDLYYRIKVVTVSVPPLRERKEDIPLLVDHFLAVHAREAGVKKPAITREALGVLESYAWPGNVRELENEIRTMISLGGETLDRGDVPQHIEEQVELMVGEESGFHDLNELVEAIESREITKALRRARGNKTKAAQLLGISRFALQRKMEKYGISGDVE